MSPLWLCTIVVIMVMYHNYCGYVTSMECVMHVKLTVYIRYTVWLIIIGNDAMVMQLMWLCYHCGFVTIVVI